MGIWALRNQGPPGTVRERINVNNESKKRVMAMPNKRLSEKLIMFPSDGDVVGGQPAHNIQKNYG
jgi:hypothetical protein